MNKARHIKFSERTRADIFVRDKAICTYSGKSLWVLDYGCSPDWDLDAYDPVRPAEKGGDNSASNGVCISSFFAAKRGDDAGHHAYFYRHGRPQPALVWFYGRVPAGHAHHLERFATLHFSDWYLNRAFAYLLLGLGWKRRIESGDRKKRGEEYYYRSALKKASQWRALTARFPVGSLEERGLNGDFEGRKTLLSIRNSTDLDHVVAISEKLYPAYRANFNALDALSKYLSNPAAAKPDRKTLANRLVSRRVKDNIRNSLEHAP